MSAFAASSNCTTSKRPWPAALCRGVCPGHQKVKKLLPKKVTTSPCYRNCARVKCGKKNQHHSSLHHKILPAHVMDAVGTSQQPCLHQDNVSFTRRNLKTFFKCSNAPQILDNGSVLGFKGFPQGSSLFVAHCIHVCSSSHEELNNTQMTRLDSRVQERLRAHLPIRCQNTRFGCNSGQRDKGWCESATPVIKRVRIVHITSVFVSISLLHSDTAAPRPNART